MKALVTGATGFLGRRLVRHLLADGHEVRCLVRPTSDLAGLRQDIDPQQTARLEIAQGNLGKIDRSPEVFENCDVVYHVAAALTGPAAVLFLDNVVATRKLMEVVSRSNVRRFVLVSSLAVHGVSRLKTGAVLDETCPLDPEAYQRDAYTYSKIVQEQAAWESHAQGRLPLVVVRPGVIYGPGRDCLTNRVGLRLGRLVLRMGGRQVLPYIHVDNCAQALVLAGTVPGIEGQSFNLVDDDPPTGRQLLKRYQREVGRVHVVPVAHFAIPPLSCLSEWYHRWSQGQLPAVLTRYKSRAQWLRLRYSNARAKAVLGWKPETGFEEGLQETFAWLREQQAAKRVAPASA
jgi:nucleoside-diphosphate-sugar epimerase